MPKLAKPLTDAQARNAKGREKVYTLADGGGMYLEVAPNGTRHWRMAYRQSSGKNNRLTFGTYPEISLDDARKKRMEARKLIAAGVDPAEHKKAQKVALSEAGADTFKAMSMAWYQSKVKSLSDSHAKRTLAYLENDLIPYLGKKVMADITAPELLACLKRIESRVNKQGNKVTETANRVRALMSEFWRDAIGKGKADRDIASDLRGSLTKHVAKNFSYITDVRVLGKLLRDIDIYTGTPATKAALKLMPLVFARPGELRLAKWSEIDLEAAEWRYFVTKTKIDHIVPLSTQAIEILRTMQPLTGQGIYVFSAGSGSRPLSENTVNQALKGLGYSSDIIQPHGFRHTAATALAELGWDENKIDRQLSHSAQGVKGVYQKSKYLADRRMMMQAWADYVGGLKGKASVTPINSKGKMAA